MLAAVRRRALRKRPGHQLGVQSPQPPLALNGENVDATTMVYRFGSRCGSENQFMETSCPSSRNRFVFMQHPFSSRRETVDGRNFAQVGETFVGCSNSQFSRDPLRI